MSCSGRTAESLWVCVASSRDFKRQHGISMVLQGFAKGQPWGVEGRGGGGGRVIMNCRNALCWHLNLLGSWAGEQVFFLPVIDTDQCALSQSTNLLQTSEYWTCPTPPPDASFLSAKWQLPYEKLRMGGTSNYGRKRNNLKEWNKSPPMLL